MTRRHLQHLSAMIALALALLVPARSWASFLPACENREVATLPPPAEPDAAPVPSCTEDNVVDEAGDSKVPALCDPRGASVIAPPRIQNIIDARIEAGAPCGSTITTPMIGPDPRDSSSFGASPAMPGHAVVPGVELLPALLYVLAPDFLPTPGSARSGTRRDVYHPPR